MLPRVLPIGLSALTLTSLGAGSARSPAPAKVDAGRPAPARGASRIADAVCPPFTLPDDSVCVRWPDDEEDVAGEASVDERMERREPRAPDDMIPRRPDRSADYAAYRYPIPCTACVVTKDDLDRSDGSPHASAWRSARSGIDLSVPRGAPVTVPALEHQQGQAELIYVGPLLGRSVVTRHSVREAGDERDYVVILGNVDATPGLASGAPSARPLRSGELLGSAGDGGASGLVRFHLEVRRVRSGVDVRGLQPSALIRGANTIACDPRNVLPVK